MTTLNVKTMFLSLFKGCKLSSWALTENHQFLNGLYINGHYWYKADAYSTLFLIQKPMMASRGSCCVWTWSKKRREKTCEPGVLCFSTLLTICWWGAYGSNSYQQTIFLLIQIFNLSCCWKTKPTSIRSRKRQSDETPVRKKKTPVTMTGRPG